MKSFFIKFWNVMMYSSFTLAGIFLLIFLSSLETYTPNYGLDDLPKPIYNQGSSFPAHVVVENIVNEIFDSLNIDFQPTQLQIFITLISLFTIFGFIFRAIVIKLEDLGHSK